MKVFVLIASKLIPLSLAVLFFLLGVSVGHAYTLWGPKWPNANPRYVFDDSFKNQNAGWHNTGEAAVNNWNNIGDTPFRFTAVGGEGENHIGAGFLISGCANLAETSRIAPFGNFTNFTVVVNVQCDFPFYDGTQAPQIPSNYYSLRTLVLHELGHGMGLCHTLKPKPVMGFVPVGSIKLLAKDDKQGNRKIYNPNYGGIGPEGDCIP